MGYTFFFTWEVSLMEWLQAHIGSTGVSFISNFSLFGEEIPLILIVGFFYWSYNKQMGRSIGLIAIMGLIWNTMIKNIVLRRRPYFDHKNIKILRVVDPSADIPAEQGTDYTGPESGEKIVGGGGRDATLGFRIVLR